MATKSKIYKWPGRNVTEGTVGSSTVGWRGHMAPPYNQMPSERTHHKGFLFLQVHQQDPTLLSQAPGTGHSQHGCGRWSWCALSQGSSLNSAAHFVRGRGQGRRFGAARISHSSRGVGNLVSCGTSSNPIKNLHELWCVTLST